MGLSSRKRDRTARLLRLQVLLWQNPNGITIREMAQKCSVSERTIFRDLNALETELMVPLWGEGNRRGVLDGYFLPPVMLTVHEAENILIASRLMFHMSQIYSPNITSTFMKINTIVPEPLKRHIRKTIEYMERLPKNNVRFKNFEKLTEAWVSQRQLRILYQEPDGKPVEHIIDIYFIEPNYWDRNSYIIAYDHLGKTVRTFKTDQIIGDVVVLDENYETPDDFCVNDFLDDTFGLYIGRDPVIVKLRFSPIAGKLVTQTIWHPSQNAELRKDGSVMLTFHMRNAVHLREWILGWGANVEVLEPESLRNQIIDVYNALREMYQPKVSR
jgi:predicted DNA-binding transcriptional regulator YafY